MMREQREDRRRQFEFFILEHRPEGESHAQAARLLFCLDFSKGGMRLLGRPRYERFAVTLFAPQDDAKLKAEVRVVHRLNDSFGVAFVAPTPEIERAFGWWEGACAPRSPGDSA